MSARHLLVIVAIASLSAACQAAPIPSPSSLSSPPPVVTATLTPAQLTGRPVKTDRPEVYRLMEDGQLRHVADWQTFTAYGYQPHDLRQVEKTQISRYPFVLPLTRWITGRKDTALFFLHQGKRYPLKTASLHRLVGGDVRNVSLLDDSFLNTFPIATDLTEAKLASGDILAAGTAAVWADDALWIARDNGSLIKWAVQSRQPQYIKIKGDSTVSALSRAGSAVVGASYDGAIWEVDNTGTIVQKASTPGSYLSTITVDGALWYADGNYYDLAKMQYHTGRGLVQRALDGTEQIYTLDSSENDPLKMVTALILDHQRGRLWIGTSYAGLLKFELAQKTWEKYTTFTSEIADNHINALKLASDGAIWMASAAGISRFYDGQWKTYPVPDDVTEKGALSLTIAPDKRVWVSGESYVGYLTPQGEWHVFSAFDHPLLLDTFRAVVLDQQGNPWFIGDRRYIHHDGIRWMAYDGPTYQATTFTPGQPPVAIGSFPTPTSDYQGWLRSWPRPADDNGRCVHYLATPSTDAFEIRQNLERLKRLGVRWMLVNYTNRAQLLYFAPQFAKAGITIVWRPFVRPYEEYPYWAKDVAFLRSIGLPPYIQVYNEASLGQEWESAGKSVDQSVYLTHLLPAMRQVYDAGGYVGLQELDPEWLRTVLRKLKEQGSNDVFQRLFFIPHAYGYNHPPAFDKDINSVLGFTFFAQVFKEEIGFVPMMIAGEGGWRPGEAQDNRYPLVTQTLHRDYLIAVLNWFQSGKLSNGEPLPDYFFAFCPWILSDPNDASAWFDSTSGDKTLLIQAVETIPRFRRKFSWDIP